MVNLVRGKVQSKKGLQGYSIILQALNDCGTWSLHVECFEKFEGLSPVIKATLKINH